MGDPNISLFQDSKEKREFTKCLINDIKALEQMLEQDMFESDSICIGAEQELVLVGPDWMPALTYDKILADLKDDAFTTELGRFNLEINLDPFEFKGAALSKLQAQLEDKMALVKKSASKFDTKVLMTGILPTIGWEHLKFEFMTPNPRFKILDELIKGRRNGNFEVNIGGMDELVASHPSILFEACNTSFQVHLQIKAHEFVQRYNWAQAIAGPVLAAAANSPLLMGKRLWRETRIALFQQSIDMRNPNFLKRDIEARVSFGNDWLYKSVAELHQNNVTRFNTLFSGELKEKSTDVLAQGKIPELKALNLHNGTVYSWNRPCYGISASGKPHLRIENRYMSAGPTLIDEMANAALWLGLMMGMPDEFKNINEQMSFETVRFNFYKGAQLGLDAKFKWMGQTKSAKDLLLTKFIPWAYEGLQKMNIDQEDIDRLLSIVVVRVREKNNGARWTHRNFTALLAKSTRAEASVGITRALNKLEGTGDPVHLWPNLIPDLDDGHKHFYLVQQVMSSDIPSVQEDDLLELVINIMVWRNVRYVMVENHQHELVGLVASRQLVKLLREGWDEDKTVHEIMETKLITVTPETHTGEAIKLMSEHNIGCLPVVSDSRLVGLLTERNIVQATSATNKFKREW